MHPHWANFVDQYFERKNIKRKSCAAYSPNRDIWDALGHPTRSLYPLKYSSALVSKTQIGR